MLLRADTVQRQPSWYGGPILVDALLDDGSTPPGGPRPKRVRMTGSGSPSRDQARAARPADALGVYLRLAGPLMKQTGNAVYVQLTVCC